ncbi:MAG TPA: GNAT family N-acetyltransferase [Candidatus Thermoplasmatota archaeon]|nr:GNAT family N-acetyltransferase [Candidatus Thermoplasmatota archaeon]
MAGGERERRAARAPRAVEPALRLPEGYRLVAPRDAQQPFGSALGWSLADYVRAAEEEGNVVLVREAEGRVVGILWLQPRVDHLLVEHLARDDRLSWPGLGSEMLLLAETLAARLGVAEVRLDALDEPPLVAWYASKGYEPRGARVEAGGLRLQPMRKRLT